MITKEKSKNTPIKKIRVAIYVRVSSNRQVEGYSLSGQEREIVNYCMARNWEIYHIYRDEGISAKDIKNRPDAMRLLEDSGKNLFDVVVVWKLSRFMRNLSKLIGAFDILDNNNVAFVSYKESFDSSTIAGRMLRNVLAAVAEFERETIAENVRMGMYERFKQGKRTSQNLFGYQIIKGGGMEIVEEQAEIIRFIFSEYLIRKNLTEVSNLCKEKNFLINGGRELKPHRIRDVLTRPTYAGYYTYKRQEVQHGDFEPIISVNTYNKVQRTLMRQGKIYGHCPKTDLIFLEEDKNGEKKEEG